MISRRASTWATALWTSPSRSTLRLRFLGLLGSSSFFLLLDNLQIYSLICFVCWSSCCCCCCWWWWWCCWFSWFGLCKKNSRGIALSTIQKLWPANHGMLGAVLLRNERSNDLWKAVVVVVRDITSSISWLMKNRQVRLLQLILRTFWQSRGKISTYQGFSRCGEVEPWKNWWRAQAVSEKNTPLSISSDNDKPTCVNDVPKLWLIITSRTKKRVYHRCGFLIMMF